jgi:hypothetical protein
VFEESVLPRIANHHFGDVGLEQIVQPRSPGSFFEGHGQSSAQSGKELKNGSRFRLNDGFHHQLAAGIHHGD